ncbi:MAG: tRNA 2-thiouridine(34) synthase MnmA [Chitinispirillaceae bacterium]
MLFEFGVYVKKILVAMSGGVDSSTVAALLKSQGHSVCGITMKLMETEGICSEESRSCCGFDAARDAKVVADILAIPHYTVNAVDAFEKSVVQNFVDEYTSGRTPNPCVRCNYHLKFDFLMKKARQLGYDYLATGHYAVIENGQLCRGKDAFKDQSYFLYPVFASSFDRIMFPLGSYNKDEVRELAAGFKLPIAAKKESQDICFIPDGDYTGFLKSRGVHDFSDGPILDVEGNQIGTHTGVHNYTVGQRKGLGALGQRMYVKEIRGEVNALVAATEEQLYSDKITVRDILCGDRRPEKGEKYLVQIRYRSRPVLARVDEFDGSVMTLSFDVPVKAAAPGQSAVLYDEDMVIAGGVIFEAR